FTSDNGPHHESYLEKVEYNADSFQSYGPFDGTKRDTWEGGIRMPTLAWRPGFIPARSIDHRASQFHDWMPTLAQLGGISPPARTDGVSLVSTLSQKGKPKNGTVYIEYNHNGRTKMYSDFSPNKQKKKRGEMQVIHLDGFKGIRHRIQSHSTPFEIYDLNQDPGEEHNLAESAPEFIELQQKMKNEVLRLRIPNSSAKRPYDGEPIPGLINTTLSSGVASWQFVKGEFPYVPKFHSAPLGFSSVKAGQGSAAIGGPMPNGVYRSNLDTTGVMNVLTYIEAKSDGQFTLEFNCSSKAFVRIHQASIFDADHGYLAGTTLVKKLKLGKGIHPVQITFLTHDEDDQKASFSLKTK
ncbi:MAG: sulfatase-like hydrolase/transferase, partial [Mariniblastus sp.]|nr:sulfatase-like hydrolase/transferase [Mariniblastus sp.]